MARPSQKQLTRALEELHLLTTEQLISVIRDGIPLVNKGEPVMNPVTGELIRVTASPAYFSAAVALLKANNIQALPDEPGMNALKKALQDLPFAAVEADQYDTLA